MFANSKSRCPQVVKDVFRKQTKKKAQPLISALLDKAFVIFIAGFCPNGCNQHIFQSLTGLNFKMKDNLVEAVE